MEPTILCKEYKLPGYFMLSGQDEAQKRRYFKYTGKSGRTWLVADQPNAAANIYVSASPSENAPGYRGFRGFGGRTLTFELKDGTQISLQGPWHSNDDALFNDTGVDVRDLHYTQVVIALEREYKAGAWYYIDVIYLEETPILGSFHRGDELAKRFANEFNRTVYLYSQSEGGSSNGWVKPKEVRDEEAPS